MLCRWRGPRIRLLPARRGRAGCGRRRGTRAWPCAGGWRRNRGRENSSHSVITAIACDPATPLRRARAIVDVLVQQFSVRGRYLARLWVPQSLLQVRANLRLRHLRIVDHQAGSFAQQVAADVDRSRFASVVGVLLEREAPDRQSACR